MDVKLVRQRIALVVSEITSRGKNIQGLGYAPGGVSPPTFFTVGVTVNRYPTTERANGTLREWSFAGKLLVGLPDEQAAQEALDELMSDGDADVAGLLEANSTLGGACVDLLVLGFTDYGLHPVAGVDYLGVNVGIMLWSF